jgi:hypothetical protein
LNNAGPPWFTLGRHPGHRHFDHRRLRGNLVAWYDQRYDAPALPVAQPGDIVARRRASK